MTLGDELLVALNANEGSLSCVGPHVGLQIACFSKLFETLFKWTNQYLFLVFWPLNFFKLF